MITAPTISSFTPTSGSAGLEVTISGGGFTGATGVTFNGEAAAMFTVDSDIQIRAEVPNGATTGPVSVSNAAGTGTSSVDFSVSLVPLVSSFTPFSGAIGTEVTLTGAHFTGATSVTFNGTAASIFTVDSDTQLRAEVPAGATNGSISLTNIDGSSQSANDFLVVALPAIIAFTPESGLIGTEVTITGTDFSALTDVTFNGISAESFITDSDTQVRATVPNGAISGEITVSNPAGTAASAASFTVSEAPSNLTFNPTDDSYVRSSHPTSNYGADDELTVRKTSSDQISYMKFSVTGVVGSVESATLRLNVTDASDEGGEIYSVSNNYEGTNDPWDEDGLLWGNAPTITGSPLDGLGNVSLNEIVEFDVTAAISADGTYSFAIKNSTSDAAKYSTNEGAIAPELFIVLDSGSSAKRTPLSDTSGDQSDEAAPLVPETFTLGQNYPNPFNIETTIEYALPRDGRVRLAIYNIRGQEVRQLK